MDVDLLDTPSFGSRVVLPLQAACSCTVSLPRRTDGFARRIACWPGIFRFSGRCAECPGAGRRGYSGTVDCWARARR